MENKKMTLANKITIFRIILSIIIICLFILPWSEFKIEFPVYVFKNILIDQKYIIAGVLFIIAALTDFLDGFVARKRNEITDFGKTMDAIADKILVNGLLIALAYEREIYLFIPIIVILRDTFTDSLKIIMAGKDKVVAASILGKIKTTFMMIGITLVLFYNLPFELFGIDIAGIILIIATFLSVASGIDYYMRAKKYLF